MSAFEYLKRTADLLDIICSNYSKCNEQTNCCDCAVGLISTNLFGTAVITEAEKLFKPRRVNE